MRCSRPSPAGGNERGFHDVRIQFRHYLRILELRWLLRLGSLAVSSDSRWPTATKFLFHFFVTSSRCVVLQSGGFQPGVTNAHIPFVWGSSNPSSRRTDNFILQRAHRCSCQQIQRSVYSRIIVRVIIPVSSAGAGIDWKRLINSNFKSHRDKLICELGDTVSHDQPFQNIIALGRLHRCSSREHGHRRHDYRRARGALHSQTTSTTTNTPAVNACVSVRSHPRPAGGRAAFAREAWPSHPGDEHDSLRVSICGDAGATARDGRAACFREACLSHTGDRRTPSRLPRCGPLAGLAPQRDAGGPDRTGRPASWRQCIREFKSRRRCVSLERRLAARERGSTGADPGVGGAAAVPSGF
ncbi:hypothetical protein FB451DRAFT_1273867 [Mycena latifolia]|nr:hypothetical protein FB451DRAFT_1273867 [Mycena latifolia]